MDEFGRTKRMVSAAEVAELLGVCEDDVLQWMLAGHIPYTDGANGEPRVRTSEDRVVDGPISEWSVIVPMSQDPAFLAELVARRRDRELAVLEWAPVDIDALSDALVSRLRAVAPALVRITAQRGTLNVHDAKGHGIAIDLALNASFPEGGSGVDRVRSAAVATLQGAQDELTMVTTDPWPQRGEGQQPEPHADLAAGGEAIRLFYGDSADPVLELDPLPIADVLTDRDP